MELEGEIKDLPYELRKKVYDEVVKIDLDEHDAFVKEQQSKGVDAGGASYKTNVPGIKLMITPKNIIASVVLLIRDTGEKKVMTFGFPRGEEYKLMEEKE